MENNNAKKVKKVVVKVAEPKTIQTAPNAESIKKINPTAPSKVESDHTQSEKPKKKPLYKQWWFWLIVAVILCAAIGIGYYLYTKSMEPEYVEHVYVEEDQIAAVFRDPEKYAGYYIRVTGKMASTSAERDGSNYIFHAYNDTENYGNEFVISTSYVTPEITEDDYVVVDGLIAGTYVEEYADDFSTVLPFITKGTISETDYLNVVSTTLEEWEVNNRNDNNGFAITLKTIEFAQDETRAYFTIENTTQSKYTLYSLGSKLVSDGKTMETISSDSYDGANLTWMEDDYYPNTTTECVLVFPAADPSKGIKIIIPEVYDADDEDSESVDVYFEVEP